MKCKEFYAKICSANDYGCNEFRYHDSNLAGEYEVGFCDAEKILSQTVLALKGAIVGWEGSDKYVGARISTEKGIKSVVLFSCEDETDPKGVMHILIDADKKIISMSGFAMSPQ